MNFSILTEPNPRQVKNLLINGVKMKIVGYDNEYNINDDLIQVTLMSRVVLYNKKNKLTFKKANSDTLLNNIQSKKMVEKIYNNLVDIKTKKVNNKLYTFDKFDPTPITKYDEINDAYIDYIRTNIVDVFAQNITYKQEELLRHRWLISSVPLVSCIVDKKIGNYGLEFELEFKSMKIPESIKNQVDEHHQFYLIFTLVRSVPMEYGYIGNLYSGFETKHDEIYLNTCVKRNISYSMQTLATVMSKPFIFTNKKSF